MSYRESHKKLGKGTSYHDSFKSQKYRRMIWNIEKIYLKKIITDNFRNEKITHLDFACGTGRILNFLEDRTSTSVGIDVSSEMISVARKTVHSQIIEGDVTKNNLLNNKIFNLVTAFRFFPNAEESLRSGVLDAIVPHIANNGLLVFNNHRNKDSFFERIIRMVFRKQYRGLNLSEVKLMVKNYDLDLVGIYSMGLFRDSFKRNIPVGLFRNIELLLGNLEILLGRFFKFRSYGYNQIYIFRKNIKKRAEN